MNSGRSYYFLFRILIPSPSSLVLLNVTCIAEKQQIPNIQFLAPEFEHTTYCTRGKHPNHYTTDGARGIVHSLKKDTPPVININGKIITVPAYKLDVYDMQRNKVLASRMQYPIMLAFAMTVHRAQGQTLQYVDVDCYSFFAAVNRL